MASVSKTEFGHYPVMLHETIEGLNVKENGIYVDGTLGGGGHAEAVLTKLKDGGRYIGIDQDKDALNAAEKRLERFSDKLTLVRSNYENMKAILRELDIQAVDGVLCDLGVSSYQLDTAERGFSYKNEGPLDMRMDDRIERTAADIVNGYSEEELIRVLREYGEEKFAARIAKRIVSVRELTPITTSTQLAETVKDAIPAKFREGKGHPAKQTFQAIRIELNRELIVLENTLSDMVDILKPGGRLCIITFHSLEDRIVKNAFKKFENPCTCPPSFPVCVCGAKSKGKVITRKPIVPGEKELSENNRSASAKLRVFEKA
ncbi:MAG: 16S rRNA (cytosine(1402)-N(4))-methyltransferase RsmH [Lachnospiraceae bacterium]|nr:16S rRNA (cytosine(1402)-N(4))-methyltransferase RsmH [Lachnospiraceae bacterium]